MKTVELQPETETILLVSALFQTVSGRFPSAALLPFNFQLETPNN